MSQEPILFASSVRENILYGCKGSEQISDDDLFRVAQMANVHDFISSMEQGYDVLCGEKGVQMSGLSNNGFIFSEYILY